MNRSASVCVVLALATLTAGCATTSEPTAYAPPATRAGESVIEQDQAYIHQVEQIAKRRGIGVTWVNPPMKRRVRTTN